MRLASEDRAWHALVRAAGVSVGCAAACCSLPDLFLAQCGLKLRVVQYRDSKTNLDTPKKILKVNHAGEFGAVNIYRAQIFVAKAIRSIDPPLLESFLKDEKRHL